MASRLPLPGSDEDTWGTILNDFLSQEHNPDGSQKQLTQSQVQNLTVDLAAKATQTDLTTLQTTVSNKADTSAVAAKYTLPGTGIPESDLAAAITAKLNASAPVQSVAGKTGIITLAKSDVGLANVDNTSDLAKPISTATQTSLSAKADVSTLATVATSGSYTDLSSKPTIPDATTLVANADLDTKTNAVVTNASSLTTVSLKAAYGTVISVKSYGAKGDGSTDDTTAITAALAGVPQLADVADAYDGTTARPRRAALYFPDGVYLVSTSITLPQNVNVVIAPGATIKATASMAAVIDTDVSVLHQDGFIDCQGIIDCNGLAGYGIYLRRFARYHVRTPRIYSPAQSGIVLGDPAAITTSYEGQVTDPYVWRANAQTVPVGSIGVWVRNATDTFVGGTGSVILGCEIGIRNDKGNNTFKSIHPWGYPPNGYNGNSSAYLPTTCFLDNTTGAVYIDCYADTPSQFGWRFTADDPRAQLLGCRLFNASSGTDNVVVAVQIDASTTGSVSVLGLQITGGSSSRVAADFAGQLGATVRVGVRCTNVLVQQGDSLAQAGQSVGILPTVTTATTLTTTQNGCQVNAASGVTITLPTAGSVTVGKTYTVKIVANGNTRNYLTVASSGLIDGRGAMGLNQGDSIQVYSDGAQWRTIARSYHVALMPAPAPASPAVSGTAYQNTTGRTLFMSVAYTPTAAGSLVLELSKDTTNYVPFDNKLFSGTGAQQYITFMLPEQYFYRLTASGATLGIVAQVG